MGLAASTAKDAALIEAAAAMRRAAPAILAENARDVADAERDGLTPAFIDRLKLTPERVEAMAKGIEEIAALPDPIGTVLAGWDRPNGLHIERVRTPLGVIGVIYESRPNVTADAGALCLKAGNAAILRGGSDSFRSSTAIHRCLVEGLEKAGLPAAAIQMVPTRDRAAVGAMLTGLDGAIDVIVPRGGKSLVKRVQDEARVPVFAHLEGICHVYVHAAADLAMATKIVVNAKMRRVERVRRCRDAARRPRRRRHAPEGAGCRAGKGGLRRARRRDDPCPRTGRRAGERGRLGLRVSSTRSSR